MKAVALLIALNVGIVISFPTGPPNGMPPCVNLMPAPAPLSSPHVRQEGNGTYDITTTVPFDSTAGYYRYTADSPYTGECGVLAMGSWPDPFTASCAHYAPSFAFLFLFS